MCGLEYLGSITSMLLIFYLIAGRMIISDCLYGSTEVTEPVLLDLLKSQAVKRLYGIDQYGFPAKYYCYSGFNRGEHSVGVFLLLRRMGASLDEQIAGLLHDASHTAFSHVGCWVAGDKKNEEHQDDKHRSFLASTDVPDILKKYSIDFERISRPENFSLLEQSAPEICADRIDYALREFHAWTNPRIVQSLLQDLKVHKGSFVFQSEQAAFDFSTHFLRCQDEHWGAPDTVARYELMTRLLTYAIEQKRIQPSDMYQDDAYVMARVESWENPFAQQMLQLLQEKPLPLVEDRERPDISIKKKFRFVDPLIVDGTSEYRLSSNSAAFRTYLAECRQRNALGISVRIVG